MESMNLLDVTIRYFNVIVFVLCVIFGATSLFASWIAWREIQKKRNLIRSIVALYNISEDAIEKGGNIQGEWRLEPAIVQTVLNTMQEVLNAMYGEVTGKPIPIIEERTHGSKRILAGKISGVLKKKNQDDLLNVATETPNLARTQKERHQSLHR